MNRFNKRTAVLDGSGFPDTLKVEEIASRIVNCFGSVNVLSIQFTPGRAIRVTFESEPFAAVVRELSVTVDDCYRFRLESICREIFCGRIYFNALITASQISIDHRSCFSCT